MDSDASIKLFLSIMAVISGILAVVAVILMYFFTLFVCYLLIVRFQL